MKMFISQNTFTNAVLRINYTKLIAINILFQWKKSDQSIEQALLKTSNWLE